MKLKEATLSERAWWEARGYELPEFDRQKIAKETKSHPFWIHFGPGNIFRAFQATLVQELLNRGRLERGLIVAEGYDYEIVERINQPQEDCHIAVTFKADGTLKKMVVGSVVESLKLDSQNRESWERLQDIFGAPSLQMVSFTITEKGYSLMDGEGRWWKEVADDFHRAPNEAMSYMGKVAGLLYTRYQKGATPIAMVSMDNCAHNGEHLYRAIHTFAEQWVENGMAEWGFLGYVEDEEKVSFPWTMIDKITPRPDKAVEKLLQRDGVEGMECMETQKKTFVAPFVNAEETGYLVVEDWFANGRPEALEEGGIRFTNRETVERVEQMKVCTCLNPLHTALAILGCLLGYETIAKEMQDPDLVRLVERIGYREGLPVVVHPGILDPRQFLDTVLQVRLPNPFIPDTPQRIVTDTSQKLPIRFGETIKAYVSSDTLQVSDLKGIALTFAGWLRYLMGVDDEGCTMTLSPDPRLEQLHAQMQEIVLGEPSSVASILEPMLADPTLFGVDLYRVGMADTVAAYVQKMIQGKGAVRRTLQEVLREEETV